LEARTIPIPMIRSDNHHERFRFTKAEPEFREVRRPHRPSPDTSETPFLQILSFQGVEGLANRTKRYGHHHYHRQLLDSMLPSNTKSQVVELARKMVEQREENS